MTTQMFSKFRRRRKPACRKSPQRFRIEALESRQLMAADAVAAYEPATGEAPLAATAAPVVASTIEVPAEDASPAPTAGPATGDPIPWEEPSLQKRPAEHELPAGETMQIDDDSLQTSSDSPSPGEAPLLRFATSAIDAAHAQSDATDAVAVAIASDLARSTGTNSAGAAAFGCWGDDYEDVKKKEDFDVWHRKKYDDYSQYRDVDKLSHEKACKKMGLDPDDDFPQALKRVYDNEKAGK